MSEVKRFLAVEAGRIGGSIVECVTAADYAALEASRDALLDELADDLASQAAIAQAHWAQIESQDVMFKKLEAVKAEWRRYALACEARITTTVDSPEFFAAIQQRESARLILEQMGEL